MPSNRRSGFLGAMIVVAFSLAVLTGCFDSSPKLYCCEDPDSKECTDTGLTLKKVMGGLEAQKLAYNYDEKSKVLEFKSKSDKYPVKIYFKNYASGLAAHKAGQHQEGMTMGDLKLSPDGDILFNPCAMLKMMAKKPKR